MNGLPYYPRYPRDFLDGTVGMSLELKGAYSIILDIIYMMGERGLPDDPQYISGQLGCSVRKWNSIRDQLVAGGKIVCENGIISNLRADKEKIIQRKYQDKQSENRSRPNKNNNLQSPRSHHTDTDTYNTLTNVSDGQAVDFTKEVFDRGVAFLGKYGTPEKSARSLIGKWRKQSGDTETFNALRDASKEGVTEPVSWITARLSRSGSQPDLDALFANIKEGASK